MTCICLENRKSQVEVNKNTIRPMSQGLLHVFTLVNCMDLYIRNRRSRTWRTRLCVASNGLRVFVIRGTLCPKSSSASFAAHGEFRSFVYICVRGCVGVCEVCVWVGVCRCGSLSLGLCVIMLGKCVIGFISCVLVLVHVCVCVCGCVYVCACVTMYNIHIVYLTLI